MSDEKIVESCEVTFHRVFSGALPPLRADESALGTLPAGAFQYCEPLRMASQYGWYVFPPVDIKLKWDGTDIYYDHGGQWYVLSRAHLCPAFLEEWDKHAPHDLKGHAPPFLTSLFSLGGVQIWSGLLISTSDMWSTWVGPVANFPQNRNIACYEGIVDTGAFKPWPLFINLRIVATDRVILLPRNKPLFQVRPILRASYEKQRHHQTDYAGLAKRTSDGGSMANEDWDGFRKTIRRDGDTLQHTPGRYGAARRRRVKTDAS